MNFEVALKNLDNPIQTFDEDLLQRRGYVENLCRIFQTASPDARKETLKRPFQLSHKLYAEEKARGLNT